MIKDSCFNRQLFRTYMTVLSIFYDTLKVTVVNLTAPKKHLVNEVFRLKTEYLDHTFYTVTLMLLRCMFTGCIGYLRCHWETTHASLKQPLNELLLKPC